MGRLLARRGVRVRYEDGEGSGIWSLAPATTRRSA